MCLTAPSFPARFRLPAVSSPDPPADTSASSSRGRANHPRASDRRQGDAFARWQIDDGTRGTRRDRRVGARRVPQRGPANGGRAQYWSGDRDDSTAGISIRRQPEDGFGGSARAPRAPDARSAQRPRTPACRFRPAIGSPVGHMPGERRLLPGLGEHAGQRVDGGSLPLVPVQRAANAVNAAERPLAATNARFTALD